MQSNAIIRAVSRFSTQNNDVSVFGKILRNEIEEEFRFTQKRLKKTVGQLLRVYMKSKHPMMLDRNLEALLRERKKGFIEENEWVSVIKYMYNEADSAALIVMVRQQLQKQRETKKERAKVRPTGTNGDVLFSKGPNSSRRRRRGGARRSVHTNNTRKGGEGMNQKQVGEDSSPLGIEFGVFVKVLLDFQLKGHEHFLASFLEAFRTVDEDGDGKLDGEQFAAFVSKVHAISIYLSIYVHIYFHPTQCE